MAIPDFQTLMLPLLKFYGDGKEHDRNEVLTKLGLEFCSSDAEIATVTSYEIKRVDSDYFSED